MSYDCSLSHILSSSLSAFTPPFVPFVFLFFTRNNLGASKLMLLIVIESPTVA